MDVHSRESAREFESNITSVRLRDETGKRSNVDDLSHTEYCSSCSEKSRAEGSEAERELGHVVVRVEGVVGEGTAAEDVVLFDEDHAEDLRGGLER